MHHRPKARVITTCAPLWPNVGISGDAATVKPGVSPRIDFIAPDQPRVRSDTDDMTRCLVLLKGGGGTTRSAEACPEGWQLRDRRAS